VPAVFLNRLNPLDQALQVSRSVQMYLPPADLQDGDTSEGPTGPEVLPPVPHGIARDRTKKDEVGPGVAFRVRDFVAKLGYGDLVTAGPEAGSQFQADRSIRSHDEDA
jgi:hypothetical protein